MSGHGLIARLSHAQFVCAPRRSQPQLPVIPGLTACLLPGPVVHLVLFPGPVFHPVLLPGLIFLLLGFCPFGVDSVFIRAVMGEFPPFFIIAAVAELLFITFKG